MQVIWENPNEPPRAIASPRRHWLAILSKMQLAVSDWDRPKGFISPSPFAQCLTIRKVTAAISIQARFRGVNQRNRRRCQRAQDVAQHETTFGYVRSYSPRSDAHFYYHVSSQRIEWSMPEAFNFPPWKRLWDNAEEEFYFFNIYTMECMVQPRSIARLGHG